MKTIIQKQIHSRAPMVEGKSVKVERSEASNTLITFPWSHIIEEDLFDSSQNPETK